MTRYFAQNTPRAGLEHMMMSVPGFQKRGGGMMILSRFCYKPEDVDCRYCLHYRKAVTQVGTAWGLPIPDTQRWLDLIRQEEIAVTQAAEPEKVNHVMEEKDLPINASGLQTLDNIWGLFETAVKLNSADGRREMYALARELSECQNLTDWIIKSQTENEGAQVSMACTQN